MEEQNTNSQATQSPFNMALATLMRLDQILKDIKDISIKQEKRPDNPEHLTRGQGQHLKTRLIKDFFLNSVPLLKEKDLEELKNKIIALKPITKSYFTQSTPPTLICNRPIFSEELEKELDNILIDIEIKLQVGGHFMPSKKDKLF